MIQLHDPLGLAMREIAAPESTRDTLALTYAFALWQNDPGDFGKVNKAIIERWSFSALEYIKTKAWKLVEERRARAVVA